MDDEKAGKRSNPNIFTRISQKMYGSHTSLSAAVSKSNGSLSATRKDSTMEDNRKRSVDEGNRKRSVDDTRKSVEVIKRSVEGIGRKRSVEDIKKRSVEDIKKKSVGDMRSLAIGFLALRTSMVSPANTSMVSPANAAVGQTVDAAESECEDAFIAGLDADKSSGVHSTSPATTLLSSLPASQSLRLPAVPLSLEALRHGRMRGNTLVGSGFDTSRLSGSKRDGEDMLGRMRLASVSTRTAQPPAAFANASPQTPVFASARTSETNSSKGVSVQNAASIFDSARKTSILPPTSRQPTPQAQTQFQTHASHSSPSTPIRPRSAFHTADKSRGTPDSPAQSQYCVLEKGIWKFTEKWDEQCILLFIQPSRMGTRFSVNVYLTLLALGWPLPLRKQGPCRITQMFSQRSLGFCWRMTLLIREMHNAQLHH